MSLKDRRGLQTYEYDEADQLLEVESDFNPEEPSMKGSLFARLGASDANKSLFKTTYGWDADGNQISKVGPGNKTSRYDFDSLDRLVGVSAPGSEPEKYLYNADRQRIATVRGKDAISERFLHMGRGRQVLGDLDGQGKLAKRYILLPSGQLLAHVDSAGTKPAFYHFDALGSIVAISDSTNRITERNTYGPYGVLDSISEPDARYGFVGMYGNRTEGTGISLMGSRFYDPSVGRFLSYSAVRIVVGIEHPYSYARNNPLTFIDPLGLFWRYSQGEGTMEQIDDKTGEVLHTCTPGYSGAGAGKNNPAKAKEKNVGPIPQGTWDMEVDLSNSVTDSQIRLTPNSGTDTTGRDQNGFLIHGDFSDTDKQGTASKGCIVLRPKCRVLIIDSEDKTLKVTK